MEKEPPRKRLLLVPAICKEILLYVPGSTLEASSKLDYLSRGVGIMHSLCKKLEVEEESGDNLEGVVSFIYAAMSLEKNSLIWVHVPQNIFTCGLEFEERILPSLSK